MQALGQLWPADADVPAPRLWWVTRGAHVLAGDAVLAHAVDHGALWGAARVVAQEHPDWWGGLVDLDPAEETSTPMIRLADHLCCGSAEDQVALRAGELYALRLDRADTVVNQRGGAYRWRTDAAYLITGGFGGIAQRIAMAMVRDGARRLVLLGRSGLPPRGDWGSHEETSDTGRRIAAVRALEHAGASVHLLRADVSDEAQLRGALDAYRNEGWPPICGVIHTAAVLESGLVRDMNRATFDRVLAPKLSGALALDRLLPELDLFIVFSSMMAFWGPHGMANYAAANAGLDVLAQVRRARGQHALSIQWGPWENIGLLDGARHASDELARSGVGVIDGDHGSAVFAALLASPEPVVTVMPIDWLTFRRARSGRDWPLFRIVAGSDSEPGTSHGEDFGERVRTTSPVARRAVVDGVVRQALVAVIRGTTSQLDPQRSFGSMGLDSLMALEFRNRLETLVGRSLPATLAWNYPTIDRLTTHLLSLICPPSAVDGQGSTELDVDLDDTEMGRLFDDVTSLSDEAAARTLRGGR